ncbi:MAG: MBL fold metallo-hydrolase [Candidatus Omnitrophica bacterium]|nr:MBL fold metallo-hydrolase [Candidatus Omnitrophota bacterium]
MTEVLDSIQWLSHASFRINYKGLIIYIDPWQVKGLLPADIIFVTHGHFDHFSKEDIFRLLKDGTSLILPKGCELSDCKNCKITIVAAGDEKEVKGIRFKVVPAYNKDKSFHPKSSSCLGYIIRLGDVYLYHAGDTDLIDEMDGLNVDIALLPVGGTYTMDAKEAALAAQILKAKVVIPMHFGSGRDKDIMDLKSNLAKGIDLKVLPLSG